MKKTAAIVFQVCLAVILNGQCITAFEDTRGAEWDYFFIYDDGNIIKQEHQKIESFKVGGNYVAYVDYQSSFKIYIDGSTYKLQEFAPESYYATDQILVFINTGEHVYVFDGRKVHYLGRISTDEGLNRLAFGDNVVAFNDYLNSFILFNDGFVTTFDNRSIYEFGANENIVTYVDPDYELKMFYNGESRVLEQGTSTQSFKVHRNIVAYVDFVGDFKIFINGATQTLENIAPLSYEAGENMVAYISDSDRRFKVFSENKLYELLEIPPTFYKVQDNMLVYTDNFNHFYVFSKGKTEKLASYTPESFQIDRDIVVFPDLDNKLMGYIDGRFQQVSQGIMSHYELNNKAVFYYSVPSSPKVFCNGDTRPTY